MRVVKAIDNRPEATAPAEQGSRPRPAAPGLAASDDVKGDSVSTTELLHRLAPLALHDSRQIAHQQKFSFVSAFVARRTETIQSINMPVAGLLVVLEGMKKIWWAGRMFAYGPGMAFALPTAAYVDVINEPDKRTGVYRALFLGFSAELLAEARRRWSGLAAGHVTTDPTVVIDAALASAILHTSEALAGDIVVSARVTEQRILEVLLLMAESGAAPLRPDIKSCSSTDAVRSIVRDRPAHSWAAASVAAQLCKSEPTLRRLLRQEGTSFREILADERMRAARSILISGRSSVAEAASLAGYTSLSHFAKRFQAAFGCLPSQVREVPAVLTD
jgi:AraC-like DNA-binding protein